MDGGGGSSSKFKQAFLKNLFVSLRVASTLSAGDATVAQLQQRRRAVKASADIALALARGRAHWARSIVAGAMARGNRSLVAGVLAASSSSPAAASKAARSRKIVKRSCGAAMRCRRKKKERGNGGKLVGRRVQVLKRLIPGGEALRGHHRVLCEALDYVSCLKAQVEAMQGLWSAARSAKS